MTTAVALTPTPGRYHQPMASLRVAVSGTRETSYIVWAPNGQRPRWAANRTELVVTDELDDNDEPMWDDVDGAHEKAATFEAATIAAGFPEQIRRAFAGWAIGLPVVEL